MKAVRLVIIALLSISMIAVGIFTVTQLSSKQPDSTTSSYNSSDSINASDLPLSVESEDVQTGAPLDESSSDEDAETEENSDSVKIILGDINLTDKDTFSGEAVTWGPGVNFNDSNQPTACVSLQEKYGDKGAVFLHDDERIYLTFDLGYESGYTNDILDVLKENNVKATFFVTGSYARNQEEIIKRIISEGHTIGNHSDTHPDMTAVSEEDAAEEINAVHSIVKEKYGYETYLFRFPAGTFSEKTLAIAAENGHHSVFWSFAYNDWDNANQPDVTEALQKTTARLHPGAVYLLHPMETNSLILSDLIKAAKDAGYEIGIM